MIGRLIKKKNNEFNRLLFSIRNVLVDICGHYVANALLIIQLFISVPLKCPWLQIVRSTGILAKYHQIVSHNTY